MMVASRKVNGISWCGPTAISVITGRSYNEVEVACQSLCHRKKITGMYTREIMNVINHFGHDYKELPYLSKTYDFNYETGRYDVSEVTVGRWLDKVRERTSTYLIQMTGHVAVVQGDLYWDTFTPETGTEVKSAPFRRKRMRRVFRITTIKPTSVKSSEEAKRSRSSVKVNGVHYRSVKAAFEALDLPLGQHQRFRRRVKVEGVVRAYGMTWESEE